MATIRSLTASGALTLSDQIEVDITSIGSGIVSRRSSLTQLQTLIGGIQNVVEDTTPQAGGDFDFQSLYDLQNVVDIEAETINIGGASTALTTKMQIRGDTADGSAYALVIENSLSRELVRFGNNGGVYFDLDGISPLTFGAGSGNSTIRSTTNLILRGDNTVRIHTSGNMFPTLANTNLGQSSNPWVDLYLSGGILTGSPTGGVSAADLWELGDNVNAPGGTLDPDNYIEINVGGTLHKMAKLV